MPYTDLVRLLSVIVPALFERPAQGTDVILALRQQKQERNSRKRLFSEQCFMIAALWRTEADGGRNGGKMLARFTARSTRRGPPMRPCRLLNMPIMRD
jgi:hypothetical protein